MSASEPYADLDTLRSLVARSTVDRLKAIIAGFAAECHTSISKYGKKNELIDRICESLSSWKARSDLTNFNKARGVIIQVKNTGSFSGSTPMPFSLTSAGASTKPRYAPPYVPPLPSTRAPLVTTLPASASAPAATGLRPTYRPKPSPFFTNEQSVSLVVECPESAGAQDRRQQALNFTLTNEHIAKLRSTTETWQLRLYCTSSSFYGVGAAAYRFSNSPCPIEFPPTCEIRVNQTQLSASTKGLKKKPGTAPPPNLGKTVNMNPGASNKVDLIYVNSQQNNNQTPTPPKKYYMTVMLVQYTNTDHLVERLKKGKYVSADRIREQRRLQQSSDDDDIVAGPSKISLKCPLSYMKIATPARSAACVHPSCFDAMSWFSVNEQTTTWTCPICEKPINQEELIVDGYFDEILKATHEDTEDVMVQADGEWHTADNEYASPAWKLSHPTHPVAPPTPAPSAAPTGAPSHSPAAAGYASGSGSGKEKTSMPPGPDVEVLILDSDSEDDRQVKRQLVRNGPASSSSVSGSYPPDSQSNTVIDLTLSDDEDTPPPVRATLPLTRKRSAVDDVQMQSGKRARTEDSTGKVAAPHRSAFGSNRGASPYVNDGTLYSAQYSPAPRIKEAWSPPPATPVAQHPLFLPTSRPASAKAASPSSSSPPLSTALLNQPLPFFTPRFDPGPRAASSSVSPFGGGPLPPPFPGMHMPSYNERPAPRFGQPPEWH
ncbi:unnamed protein product [Peniophora sp. CBMAI 1063]|nr:unnamed protein product [Peniophora sp. CBMAI 1063]